MTTGARVSALRAAPHLEAVQGARGGAERASYSQQRTAESGWVAFYVALPSNTSGRRDEQGACPWRPPTLWSGRPPVAEWSRAVARADRLPGRAPCLASLTEDVMADRTRVLDPLEGLRRPQDLLDQEDALWRMSVDERVAAMYAGRLSWHQLTRWSSRHPEEVPELNAEFWFLAIRTPEIADRPAAPSDPVGQARAAWEAACDAETEVEAYLAGSATSGELEAAGLVTDVAERDLRRCQREHDARV